MHIFTVYFDFVAAIQQQHISAYTLVDHTEDESEPTTWDYWGQNISMQQETLETEQAFMSYNSDSV